MKHDKECSNSSGTLRFTPEEFEKPYLEEELMALVQVTAEKKDSACSVLLFVQAIRYCSRGSFLQSLEKRFYLFYYLYYKRNFVPTSFKSDL